MPIQQDLPCVVVHDSVNDLRRIAPAAKDYGTIVPNLPCQEAPDQTLRFHLGSVVAKVHIVNAVVLYDQERLCTDRFCPGKLPFKPLPVLREVAADFGKAHLALDKHIVLQGLVSKHCGVIPEFQFPHLMGNAVLFEIVLAVRILLPGVTDDCQL